MIAFKNVTYRIKNKTIIDNLSFTIKPGEKVLITGKSGCGKTTIFNLIMLNIRPTIGNIYYGKENILNFNEERISEYRQNNIANILQIDDLFDNLTVMKNLLIFFNEKDIEKMLKKAGLYYLKDRIIYSLSGGERQRIAIIKAAMLNNDVLLCDEITSALDHENSVKIVDFILKIFNNKTVLFISHDSSIFEGKINRTIIFKDNKIEDNQIVPCNIKDTRQKQNKRKAIMPIMLRQGIVKLSIFNLIIMILSVFCFYISLNFDNISEAIAYKSYSQYVNYDVLEVIDNDSLLFDGKEIFYDYSNELKSTYVYLDGARYINIQFKPYRSKNDKHLIVNKSLLDIYNIDIVSKISFTLYEIKYVEDNIDIVRQDMMFSSPCIFYDVVYFNNLYKIINDKLVITDYDFKRVDDRFTNNPLFENKKENKPYLNNDAYLDYLTYLLVFNSIKDITNYFFIIITIYVIIVSILVNISVLIKDIKQIAIYISRGYNILYIYFSYFLSLVLYSLLLCPLMFIDVKFIIYIIFSLIIQGFSLLIGLIYIKHKPLYNLLKEESLT